MFSRHHNPGRRKWCWVLDSMALARASARTSTGGILRGPWAGHFPSPCLVSLMGAEGPGLGPRKGHDFHTPFCLHTCPLVCGGELGAGEKSSKMVQEGILLLDLRLPAPCQHLQCGRMTVSPSEAG